MIQTSSDIRKWNHNAGLLATKIPGGTLNPDIYDNLYFALTGSFAILSVERHRLSFFPPFQV